METTNYGAKNVWRMIFSSSDNVLNAKTDLEVMMKHSSVIFQPTFRKISHELPLKSRNGHHRPNSRLLYCPLACLSPQTMVHVNPPSIENTPCGLCAPAHSFGCSFFGHFWGVFSEGSHASSNKGKTERVLHFQPWLPSPGGHEMSHFPRGTASSK